MKSLIFFLFLYAIAFSIYGKANTDTVEHCLCGEGYYTTLGGTWSGIRRSSTPEENGCVSSGYNFELHKFELIEQTETRYVYNLTKQGYNCKPIATFKCADGAPPLKDPITSISTCDRTCTDVGYEIGSDGQCSDPKPCEDALNACFDSCNSYIDDFHCSDGQIIQDCVCQDKCSDYASQCSEYCESQGMIVNQFSCSDNNVDVPCECAIVEYEDNTPDPDNTTNNDSNTNDNMTDNDTTNDPNTNIDDTNNPDNTDNTTGDNGTTNNYYYTTNNNYSSAPAGGTGTGGNSLSDDLNNLGSTINENTGAVNENTSILDEINEALSPIVDFLSDASDLISNPTSIGDTINQYLTESVSKYNESFFNDSCQAIETIRINYHGREVVFLSQDLIDNYFPIDLMKKFIIFIFAFSGVMVFFRSNS